ncbi:MAG: nucleoside hydrolase [Oligoflexales bacterium]|nr:nucleoside hydrolase [Oligoflexales bacterium]
MKHILLISLFCILSAPVIPLCGMEKISRAEESKKLQRVLIDTDPGVDDAMALILAFGNTERIRIEGITVVFGNSDDLNLLSDNACILLSASGYLEKTGQDRPDLSVRHPFAVVAGAGKPLFREYSGGIAKLIHGNNGLGDVIWKGKVDYTPKKIGMRYSSAAEYIVKKAKQSPGQLTLVALGPLTNIALALQMEPGLPSLIQRLVIMGGVMNQAGNMSPVAEANIYNDPEAARKVFESGMDIWMAGLDITRTIPLSDKFREDLSGAGEIGLFLHDITDKYVRFFQKNTADQSVAVNDSTAVMFLLHPELFQTGYYHVDIETRGEYTTGMTVVDSRGYSGRPRNAHIISRCRDLDRFYDFFLESVRTIPGD